VGCGISDLGIKINLILSKKLMSFKEIGGSFYIYKALGLQKLGILLEKKVSLNL
jgi:hypothetical protein